MTAFTRLGAAIWTWEPWVTLRHAEAQLLWLALYTSNEAKRHAPGLWQGGVQTMAEAASMRADTVMTALERLLGAELVEYDPKYRVLRLCLLPDPGEFPSNGKVILSWWTRFGSVPECAVRDAHVTTLRWIMDEGSRQRRNALSEDHETAWKKTFGNVKIPRGRSGGTPRTLLNSDTSTRDQPSLFGSPEAALPSGNGIAPQGESGYPQHPQRAVDNSDSVHQMNKNERLDTVSDTVSDTNRIPDPDLGSRISSGEGEGGRGARPVLTLVPDSFTAREVLAELGQSHWDPAFDQSHQAALSALIPHWVALGVGADDLRVLREYNAFTGARRDLRWLLGCDIRSEINRARKRLDWRDVQAKAMSDSLP